MTKQLRSAFIATFALFATASAASAQDTIRLSDSARIGQAPTPNPGRLSDANILAILSVRNAAEIEAGLIASQRGSSAAVRQYGMMLVRDHRRAMAEGQALARRLGATPTAPDGYSAPMPPADAWEVISKRSVHAEQVNAMAKATDPRAEAKSYKDQVRGTDEQGAEAVPPTRPAPEIVREPSRLNWLPGDTTGVRLGQDAISTAHADAMLRLQGLSGAEFDRAFAEYAVIAHEAVLNEVQSRLLPDADSPQLKGMLEKKPLSLINHRKAAERLLR